MVFTDGKSIVPMVSSQDHKRIFDGDKGPNTGGMGAYSPAPVVTGELEKIVLEKIMKTDHPGAQIRRDKLQGDTVCRTDDRQRHSLSTRV